MMPHAPPTDSPSSPPAGSSRASRQHKPARTPADAASRAAPPHAAASSVAHTAAVHIPAPVNHPSVTAAAGLTISGRTGQQASASPAAMRPSAAVSHAAVASSRHAPPSLQSQHQQRPALPATSDLGSSLSHSQSQSGSTPYLNQEVLLMNREGSRQELFTRGGDAEAASSAHNSDTDSLADDQLSFNRLPRDIVPAAAVDAAMRYIADGSRRSSQQPSRHKPKHSEASNSDDSDHEGANATFLTGLSSSATTGPFFGKVEPFGAPAATAPTPAAPAAAVKSEESDSEELANQALHRAQTMEHEEKQQTKSSAAASSATSTMLRPTSIVITEPQASSRPAAATAAAPKQSPQRTPSMMSGAVTAPRTRRKASVTPAALAAAVSTASASAASLAPAAAAAAAEPNPNLTIPSRWFELTSFGSGYVSGSRLRRQIAELSTRSEAFIKDLLAEEGPALITPEIIAHSWFSSTPRAAAVASVSSTGSSVTAASASIIAEAAAASAAEIEASTTSGSEARARARTALALKDLKALDARIGFVPDSADSPAVQSAKRAEQIELVTVLESLEAQRSALRDLDASGAVKFLIDPPSAEPAAKEAKKKKATASTGNLLPSSLSNASLTSSISSQTTSAAASAAAADASGVPLQQQGDLNFYTLHHLLDRECLKFSREICVAIREWWAAAEKITVAPSASSGALSSSGLPLATRGVTLVPKREYEHLMRLLYFVLVDCDIFEGAGAKGSGGVEAAAAPKNQKEADERAVAISRKKAEFASVIQRDWIVDSADGSSSGAATQEGLNFAQFHRSLFQLADHWVPSLAASSYARFLHTLLNILTEAEEDEFGTIHRSWKNAPFSFDLGPALGLTHRKLYVPEETSPDWLADLTDWPSDDEAELGALLAPEVEQIETALAEEARLFPALEDVTRALKLAGVTDLNANSFYSTESLGSGFSSRSSGGPLSARSSTGAFNPSAQSLVKITASQAADSGIGSLSIEGIVRDVGGNVIGRQSRVNPQQILDVEDESIVVGTVALHKEEIERELAKAALTNKENALTAKMVAKEQAAAAAAAAAAQATQAQASATAVAATTQAPNSPSSNALPLSAPVLAPSGSSRSIAARAQELIFANTLSPAEAHRAAMAAAIRRKLPKGLLGALRDAGLVGVGKYSLLPPPAVRSASIPVAPGGSSTVAAADATAGATPQSAEEAQAAAAASAAQASEARSILGDVAAKAQAAEIIAGRTKVVRATNGQMILIKLQSGSLLNSLTNLKSKASAAVSLRKKMASNLPAARSGEILKKNATFKKRMEELVVATANLNEHNTDRNAVVAPRSSDEDEDDEDDDGSEGVSGSRRKKKRLGALLSKHSSVLLSGAAGGESAYLASQKALKAKLDAAELEKQEAANARVAADLAAAQAKEQAALDKLAAEKAKQDRLDEIIRKLTNSVRNLDSEPTKEMARLAAQRKAQEEEAKLQDKQDRAAERRRSIQMNKSASASPATGRSRAGSVTLNVDMTSSATVMGLDDDSALARAMKAALAVRDSPPRKPVNAGRRSAKHSRHASQEKHQHHGHAAASDDLGDRLRPHGSGAGAHRRNRSALAPGESESITDPVTGAVLTRRRKLSAAPPKLKTHAGLSPSQSKGTLSSSPSASALATPSTARNDADDDDSEHEYADESTGGGWVTSKGGAASAFKSLSRRLVVAEGPAAGGKHYLDHSHRGYQAPIQQGHWSKAGGDRFKEMYRFIASDSDYVRAPPSKSRPASPGAAAASPIRRGLRHQPSVSAGGGYGDDDGGSPAAGALSKSNSTPAINADTAAMLGATPILSEEAYETQVEKLTRLRRERHALEAVRKEREAAWAAKLALIRKRKAALERGETFEPTAEERELERALLATKRGGGGGGKPRSLVRHANGGSSSALLKAGSSSVSASPKTEPTESADQTPTVQSLDAPEDAVANADVDPTAEDELMMHELPPSAAETAEELALREEEESVKALLVTHLKREEAREKLAQYLNHENAKAHQQHEQERGWNQPSSAEGRSKTPPQRPSRIHSQMHSRSQSQTVSRQPSRVASRTSSRASSRRGSVTKRSRSPSPAAEASLATAPNNQDDADPDAADTPRGIIVVDAAEGQASSRSSSPAAPPAVTFAESIASGPRASFNSASSASASVAASAASASASAASASDKFKNRMKHTPLYVPREKRTFKPVSRKDRDEILNRYDEDEEKRKRAEARKLAQIKLLKQTAAGAAVVQKKLGAQGAVTVPLAGALGLVDPSDEKSLLLPSKKLTLNPADLLAGAAKLTSSPRKSIFGNRMLVGHVAALQVAADAANKAEAEARRVALAGGAVGSDGSPLAPSPAPPVLSARGSFVGSLQMIHSGVPVFTNGGWSMPASDVSASVGVNIPLLKGEKLATPALLTKSASQDDIRVLQKSSSMHELDSSLGGAGLIGGAMALRGGKRKFAPRHSVFAAPKQSAKINIPGRKAAVAALAAAAAAAAEKAEAAAAAGADTKDKAAGSLNLPSSNTHRHSFSTPFATLLKEATATVAAAAAAKEAAMLVSQQQQQPVPDGPALSLGPHVVTISISPPSAPFDAAAVTPADDAPSDAQASSLLGGDMSLDAKGTAMTVQKRVTRATELSRSRRASTNVLAAPVSPVLSGIGPKVDSRRNSSRRASREVPKDAAAVKDAAKEAVPAPATKPAAADKSTTEKVRRVKSVRKSGGASKGAALAAALEATQQSQADDDADRQFDLSRTNSDVSDAAASESDSDDDDSPSKARKNKAEPVEDPWAATPVPETAPVAAAAAVPDLSLAMATPVLAVTAEHVDVAPAAAVASIASAPVAVSATGDPAAASDEGGSLSEDAEAALLAAEEREEEAARAVLIAQAIAELARNKQRQQEQLAAEKTAQDAVALAAEAEKLVAAAAAENASRLAAAIVEADRAAAEAAEVAALADKKEREQKARAVEDRQRRAREDAAAKQAEFLKQHQDAQAALAAKQAALVAAVAPAPATTVAAVQSSSKSSSARVSPIIVVQDSDSSVSSDSSDSDSSSEDEAAAPAPPVVLPPVAAASLVRSISAGTTPTTPEVNATEISPWRTSTSQHGTRSGSPHSSAGSSATDHTRPPSNGSSHTASAHSLPKKGSKVSASAVPLRGHGAAASIMPFVPVKSFMSQPPPSAAHVPKHKSKHAATGAAAVVKAHRRRSQDAHTIEKQQHQRRMSDHTSRRSSGHNSPPVAARLGSPPVVLVSPVLRYITPTAHQLHPNINIIITPDARAGDKAEDDAQGSNSDQSGMFDLSLSQAPPLMPSPVAEEVLTPVPVSPQPELPPSVTPDEIAGKAAVPFIIIPTRFKQDPSPKSAASGSGTTSVNSRSPASATGSGNASVVSKTHTADSSPKLSASASPPSSSLTDASAVSHAAASASAGEFTAADWLRGFHSDHPAEHAIFAGKIDDKGKEDDAAKKAAAAASAAAAAAATAEREALEAKTKQSNEAALSPVVSPVGADSSSLPTSPALSSISRTSSKTGSQFEASQQQPQQPQSAKPLGSFALVGANRSSLKFAAAGAGSLSAMLQQAGATINQTAAPASDTAPDPAVAEEARHQASTKALHKDIAKALEGTVVAADGTLHHTSSTGSLQGASSKLRKGNVISKRGSLGGHQSSASFQASYAHVNDLELTGATVDAGAASPSAPSEESHQSERSRPSRSHTRHSSQASIAEEEAASAADQLRRAINDVANAEVGADEDAAPETSPQPAAAESTNIAASPAAAPSKPTSVRRHPSGLVGAFNASANAAAVAAAAAAQPKQAPATALDLIPPQRPGAGLSWPLSRDRINRNRGALKDMGKSTTSKPLVDRVASGLSLSKVEAALQQVVNSVPLSVPASARAAGVAQADALASREVAVKEDVSFAFRARLVGGPHIQRNRGLRPARVLTTLSKAEQKDDEAESPSSLVATAAASSSFLHIGHDGEKSSRAVGKQPVASSKLRRPVHAVAVPPAEEKQDGPSATMSGSLADLLHSEPLSADPQRHAPDADAQPSGSDSDDALSPGGSRTAATARGRSRDASTAGFKPSTAESRARPASLSPLRNNKGQSASTRVPFGALRSQLLSGEIVLDETPAAAAARRRHEANEKARRARERKTARDEAAAAAEQAAEEKDAEDMAAWAGHDRAPIAPVAAVSSIPEDAAFSSSDEAPSSPVSLGKKRVPRSRRRDYSIHSRMQVSLAGSLVDSRAEEQEKQMAQKSWVDATAPHTEELAALTSQHANAAASHSSPSASPAAAPAVPPSEQHHSAYAPALHLSLAGSYLAPALLVQSLKSRPTPSWTRGLQDGAEVSEADGGSGLVAETIGHLHEKKLLEAAGKLPAIVAAAAAASAAASNATHEPERANTPLSRLIAKGEVASAASLTSQQPSGAQSARSDKPKRTTHPAPHQSPPPPHSARGLGVDFDRPLASIASPFSSYVPSPPLRPSLAFAPPVASPPAGMAPLLPSPPATLAVNAASHLSFTQQAAALLSPSLSSGGSSYARPAGMRRPAVMAVAPTSVAAATFSSPRVAFASGSGAPARPVSPVDLTPRFTFQLPKKAAQIR